MKRTAALLLLALALPGMPLARAQDTNAAPNPAGSTAPTIIVADGSSSGTYELFLQQIEAEFNGAINFKRVPSSGAIQNLDLLINNEVSVAFMHSDVLAFRSKNTDMTHFKTLLALFSEDVHFVALSQPKGSSWGFTKPAPYNTIEDLKGKKVGAAGGGVITANVIRNSLLSAGAATYTVVEYPSGGDALNALANGDVDAVEFTGAAPLPNLAKLNSDYKILSIPDNVAHELSDIYHPATVTYVNMRPDGVQTIAADCIVVARDYKSPRLWKPLKQFRDLFFQDLTDIQETPGNHTKWSEVKPGNHGKWPWLVFPGEAPVSDDAPVSGGAGSP